MRATAWANKEKQRKRKHGVPPDAGPLPTTCPPRSGATPACVVCPPHRGVQYPGAGHQPRPSPPAPLPWRRCGAAPVAHGRGRGRTFPPKKAPNYGASEHQSGLSTPQHPLPAPRRQGPQTSGAPPAARRPRCQPPRAAGVPPTGKRRARRRACARTTRRPAAAASSHTHICRRHRRPDAPQCPPPKFSKDGQRLAAGVRPQPRAQPLRTGGGGFAGPNQSHQAWSPPPPLQHRPPAHRLTGASS